MHSRIYTFYRLISGIKISAICFLLFTLLSGSLKSQDDVAKILRLNSRADSLTYIDTKAAVKAANEALEIAQKLNNDSLEYASRFCRAVANYFIGNINSSLEDFIKNKALAQKMNDQVRLIESLNAIGNVYKEVERNSQALQSYYEALAVCKKIKDGGKMCLVESNIAMVMSQLRQFDSSSYYCHKVLGKLHKYKKGNDLHFVSSVYGILLSNYFDSKNHDSVIKYSNIVLPLLKKAGNKISYAGNLYNLGGYYAGIGNNELAEKYYSEAVLEKPDNLQLMVDLHKSLGSVFYAQKKYKLAAEMYFDCIAFRDSLAKVKTIETLSEMEVKYETGKKEEELKRLSAEKEITDLKAKQSRVWLIASSAGILFVIIVAVVLLKQNRNRREANKLLQLQNNEIVHQKKEITDSINYAKRIQLAILPPDKMVKRLLPNAFVLYKPKDVVSGDFYWLEEKNGKVLFAAVDCTGHGVPGAMMSVVGLNLLNQAVKEKGLTTPSEILKHLDAGVTDTLRQSGDIDSIKDGMDLSLCAYNPKTLELQYAGAFNNLWIVRKNISSSYVPSTKNEVLFEDHLLEIKADKFPIGSNLDGVVDNYTNWKLQLQKGDCVYLYSDGFADQFGGPKGKKFKYNALKKFLVSVHHLPPAEQREKLVSAFESWKGNLEQVDDILVLGVCV